MFVVSCGGFVVGSLISAFAGEFYVLLFGRLVSSLGAGLSIPLMFNLIVEVMPQKSGDYTWELLVWLSQWHQL